MARTSQQAQRRQGTGSEQKGRRGPAAGAGRAAGSGRSAGTGRRAGTQRPARPRQGNAGSGPKRGPGGGAGSGRGPGRGSGQGAGAGLGNPRRRILVVLVALLAVVLLVTARLFGIQGMDTAELAESALKSRLVVKKVPADRGVIIASDGTVLADNADRYRLVVDQQNVKLYKDANGNPLGAWGAAKALAGPLDTSPGLVYKRLNGDRLWNVVAAGLTSEVWNSIDALDIPGISSEKYSIRTYPDGAVGGNLVGFVGSDGEALAGMELKYASSLKGRDGSQRYERGLSGDQIPLGDNENVPAVNGTGVRLSINPSIQYYAQKAIADAVKQREAEWGTVTMLDTRTGRILAAAESPSVDPNNPGKAKSDDRGSRVFTASFEPGSTAKMVTAAGLLDQGKVNARSRFTVPYKYKAANGEEFKDSHEHKTEKLTFAGILMESSNTGTVQAGQRLTKQQRYDYLHRFGFGTRTAVGFPGETAGILHKPKAWDGRTQYTVMFGQGVASTSLQNASVIATIANGGKKVQPQLVTGTVDDSGRVTDIPPDDGTQVIGQDSASQLMTMLEGVVAKGTGKTGKIPGYRVAGKTGTAQAPTDNGKGYSGYTASFAGAVPAENPRIAVSVTLQRPKKGYYGGTSAAPVFSDVAGYALRQLGVPPSTTKADLPTKKWK